MAKRSSTGSIAGPQPKGSTAASKPGRGAGGPRVAPTVGTIPPKTGRAPIAPQGGKI